MKIVLQRVSEAKVEVDGETIGQIDGGYLLLLGVTHGDSAKDIDFLVEKIMNLRLFPEQAENKHFEKSILEIQGEILVVSQFTLYGRTDKGRRPSFVEAAKPEEAEKLYNLFVQQIKQRSSLKVETGKFQAMMKVHLVNDGPVTFLVSSE